MEDIWTKRMMVRWFLVAVKYFVRSSYTASVLCLYHIFYINPSVLDLLVWCLWGIFMEFIFIFVILYFMEFLYFIASLQ